MKNQKIEQENKKILDEDTYLQEMEGIIKRDFFPINLTEEESLTLNPNISLNDYLAITNSIDNEDFNKQIKKNQKRFKQKYSWMYEKEADNKQRQEQLQLKQQQEQNQLLSLDLENKNFKRENILQINECPAKNNLFFNVNNNNLQQQNALSYQESIPIEYQNYNKKEGIKYQNTRLNENEYQIQRDKKQQLNEINQENKLLIKNLMQTPQLSTTLNKSKITTSNYNLRSQKFEDNCKPQQTQPLNINGYQMLDQTPYRNTFCPPKTPQREELLKQLAQKISSKNKRVQLQKQQQQKTNLIRIFSQTPKRPIIQTPLPASIKIKKQFK